MKPLSPRRAREFRDRASKRMFGDRKSRMERHVWLTSTYGPNIHEEMKAAAKAAIDDRMWYGLSSHD